MKWNVWGSSSWDHECWHKSSWQSIYHYLDISVWTTVVHCQTDLPIPGALPLAGQKNNTIKNIVQKREDNTVVSAPLVLSWGQSLHLRSPKWQKSTLFIYLHAGTRIRLLTCSIVQTLDDRLLLLLTLINAINHLTSPFHPFIQRFIYQSDRAKTVDMVNHSLSPSLFLWCSLPLQRLPIKIVSECLSGLSGTN